MGSPNDWVSKHQAAMMSDMVKRETTRYYELPLKERDSITYEGALPKEKNRWTWVQASPYLQHKFTENREAGKHVKWHHGEVVQTSGN